MRVDQIMNLVPATCHPDDDLSHAAAVMWNLDCGSLPVCTSDGSNRVLGMVTDRDICMCAHFRNKTLKDLRVSDAMPRGREIRSCAPNDSLADAERIMREARVRRLPVIASDGTLMGLLSLADLAGEAVREHGRRRPEITESEIGATLAEICRPEPQPRMVATT